VTNTKTTLLLMAVLLAMVCDILSCSRGTPPATEEIDLGEAGVWTWVSSFGGISGDAAYADNVDYTKELTFDDNDNYVYTRDGFIESAGRYVVSSVLFMGHDQPEWVIRYADEQLASDVIIRLDADTLVLAQDVVDGFQSTYVRSLDK
jgi:hypothetical protein